jgi:CBS domain-containing protein
MPHKLSLEERQYYRDELRAARYSALADSEGFLAICYALEALGLRLLDRKESLGAYKNKLKAIATQSVILSELPECYPGTFTGFDALFDLVKTARNDAMHTGVYARHAAAAGIELCIGLEEALMNTKENTEETPVTRQLVKDYMVKSPIVVEAWQPVAQARQLMLTHSFSFLPVKLDRWKLVSETAMARYVHFGGPLRSSWKERMGTSIEDAAGDGLTLLDAKVVGLDENVHELLGETSGPHMQELRLWLVLDKYKKLCGVLSPFELM